MKFIHLADVHLGAVPDKGFPWSAAREEEIWETFRRVIAGIRENPVDLLFIAGDLFHRQPLPGELKEVNYLFSTIPETHVFLMAGNHDYMRKDSFYRTFSWEENVHFFAGEKLKKIHLETPGVTVYGLGYEHQEIREPLYDKVKPEEKEGFRVLLAHGGDGDHIPMNFREVSDSGFDYIALGHIHRPQVLARNRMIYPGALEPIDRNDTGPHGYVEGTYENGTVQAEFVPFATRSYQKLTLTLREDSTQLSLEDMLRMDIKKLGSRNIYRVVLEGVRSPDLLLINEKLKGMGNVIEVEDHSRPAYDPEALLRQYGGTLIGDYIEYFLEKDRSPVEDKAFYYGLQALLETSRTRR